MTTDSTRGLRPVILLLLLFLAISPGVAHAGGTVDDIVAQILKAYGGADVIGRVRSVAARGTIIDFFSDAEGAYNRYLERPGKLRIEIMPETGGEVRILNGNDAWQSGRNGIGRARPLTHCSMKYQYTYLDLPMGLVNRSMSVAYDGTDRLGDHDVHLLRITPADAPEVRVYVDTKTYMILRVAADFSMGIMGMSELSTEYGDFRAEAGVLFPHLLANYAGEIKLSEIILPHIQVNAVIPEALFAPQPTARR
jgi:outer membrane lipoprotein-sorting protein